MRPPGHLLLRHHLQTSEEQHSQAVNRIVSNKVSISAIIINNHHQQPSSTTIINNHHQQ
jgi:hypothetical protein